MFSLVGSRLFVPLLTRNALLTRVAPLSTLQHTVRRTFLTTATLWEPAKKAEPKTAGRKKTTTTTKSTTKTKPKAKKAAPKKKVASKAVAKKPKARKVKPAKKVPVYKPSMIRDGPPKRPPSPFILFSLKYRAGMDLKGDRQKVIQSSKDAGAAWRALTEHEKQAFVDENQALQPAYREKLAEYTKNADITIIKALNKKRVEAGKPRIRIHKAHPKPMTSFLRFYQEQLAKRSPDMPVKEVTRAAAQTWKTMTEAEKKPYADAWLQEKEARAK
ncbi:hypothetical protein PUNSTDRAFT_122362 [Punctularia strigosozonata HHB-11173 SS5]|uniref:uncharacterized protein n=1 Tax=Punctularia strigosozonata (strain HHB-11173) TaxID=741275 RepID=UPI0004417EAC|nr:uncharacterized protein PUNSTDRAFT_122362 [Punctularia strigosozonata HHB-11173 SS5]EIN05449.1 hypothetical protein PUNSTDRAFT_122362 [Punctularia strigosozonata HHB-11173 SS5]